jgi:hypothetical protein
MKIARLDGCEPFHVPEFGWHCNCDRHQGGLAPHYSEDLNALVELIRRRWPGYTVVLRGEEWSPGMEPFATLICRPWTKQESRDRSGVFDWHDGATDAERLANAVVQALEAERE